MFLLNIHYTAPYSPFFCHPHPHFYSVMFFSSHIFPSPLFLSLPVTMFSHALPHSLSLHSSILLHCALSLSYTLFITLSPHLSLSSALSLNALSFSIPTFYILVSPCLPLSKTLPCILSLSPCQYSLTISVLSPLPLFDSSPSFSLSLSPYPLSLSCPLVVSLCPPSHSPIYLSQTHLPLTLLSLTGLLLTEAK